MPLGPEVTYRWKTSSDGTKVRLAFKKGQVVEVKKSERIQMSSERDMSEPVSTVIKRVLKKKFGRKVTSNNEKAYQDGFVVTGDVPKDPKAEKARKDAELLKAVARAAGAATDPKKRRGRGKDK